MPNLIQNGLNALSAGANALNNPNSQNLNNAAQAGIAAMNSALDVGKNIVGNIMQHGSLPTSPNPALVAKLSPLISQTYQTAVNAGSNPTQTTNALTQVATAILSTDFNKIDSALQNLDAAVPSSVDTLKETTKYLNVMATDPMAQSIITSLGGPNLSAGIANLSTNVNEAMNQYATYTDPASGYFQKMGAKVAVGHNIRQASGDLAGITSELKALGL